MANEQRAMVTQQGAALLEKVVIEGDLTKLQPAERVAYYKSVCDSLGLNPLTKPFDYITLNGKLTLYARKDCADQLRRRDGVSVTGLDAQIVNDVYVVKAKAAIGSREDMATGAVSIKGLSGDALANAMMKAETKAKRRVTLSICGLGMLDETEIETVSEARPTAVDMATGEIKAPMQTQPATDAASALVFSEYIKDAKTRARFWQACTEIGLDQAAVHAALNVQHLSEVTGTVKQVWAVVRAYAESMKPALQDDLFAEHSAVRSGETA